VTLFSSNATVAVIGAGVAGLACARRLQGAGCRVRVFDKGRSVGGRLSTRRVETPLGPAQFDHGAQFFTARDGEFLAALAQLPREAALAWAGRGAAENWSVAAPGMSSLAKALAQGLDVRVSTKVEALERDVAGWDLIGEAGALLGRYEAVVSAVPAEQAVPLLAPAAQVLALEARLAVTAPCWAGLFAFAEPVKAAAVAYPLEDQEVLTWLACDSAKPGRPDALACWVAHATPAWTRARLEASPDVIAPLLLDAVSSVLGPLPAPVLAQAHRWRFAKVERPNGSAFGWDAEACIGACGDWRLGPRVELAWRSGHDLAGAILS
jgi:predicted NAD/FAD-dependent oxidoreductase